MRANDWAVACIVLLASAFVGYVELHTTEPSVTVAFIVAFALLAGVAKRRLCWLSGLVIGGAVPAAYAFAALAHVRPREFPQPDGLLTNISVGAFTVIVGVVAAACGATIARIGAKPAA